MNKFCGVWKRTQNFEPIGTLVEEDPNSVVLWLQSSCGAFIDIRVEKVAPLRTYKSFCGFSSFDESNCWLTWDRQLDFRPLGAPDIGKIDWLSDTVIQEDGVLEGDDYREIWENLNGPDKSGSESVLKLSGKDSSRTGCFLVVGEWFGLCISRADGPTPASDDTFRQYFSGAGGVDEEEVSRQLLDYTCVVGKTSDWTVLHSLDTFSIGSAVNSNTSPLHQMILQMRVEVQSGSVPSWWPSDV